MMRERILLAPGASPSELLRTLAKSGINTIGLRIVSALELARIALMRSGMIINEVFLPSGEEPSLVFSLLADEPYFSASSYADAESMAYALSSVRKLAAKDEEQDIERILLQGEFADKNTAIINTYKRYISACKANGRIDSIGIIRKAIAGAGPIDAEFISLKEFPLTPLENELLKTVSGGSYTKIDLPALFHVEKKPLDIKSFTKGYGAVNESENILSGILSGNIPLDKCVIACADTNGYSQLFYDLSRRYDIPISFGSGIPVENSYPAILLKLLYKWNTSGYNGIDALREVIFSDAFDRKKFIDQMDLKAVREDLEGMIKMAGSLRISFNRSDNDSKLSKIKSLKLEKNEPKYLAMTETLAKELELGYAGFIRKYSVIRYGDPERLDQSGLSVVCTSLDAFEHFAEGHAPEEIIPDILNKTVSSEASKEGKLHVCSIKAALSSLREDLFVCGLSSADFPGNPSENYLLLDSDLELFDATDAPTSSGLIRQKKETLHDLLTLASALGSKVRLSYPDYDLAAVKDQNPSSILFEIYEAAHPGSGMDDLLNEMQTAGYFESGLSPSDAVGTTFTRGAAVAQSLDVQSLPDTKGLLDKYWSPTALELFFSCPRHFYLKYVCGLPEDEPDDPFTVMSAADQGTIVHKVMETIANKKISRDEFLALSSKAFEDFLLRRPPLNKTSAAREKAEFLKMMESSFDSDPGNKVLTAEEKYKFTHPSGIKLEGYPDRVEETPEGKYIIADFKTKRKVDHKPDDIETCLQVVIYAWLCSQAGIDVSRAEYRYLRKARTIECAINDAIYKQLNEKLLQFRAVMESCSFPRDPGKSNKHCRYCTFADICDWDGKEVKEAGEDA